MTDSSRTVDHFLSPQQVAAIQNEVQSKAETMQKGFVSWSKLWVVVSFLIVLGGSSLTTVWALHASHPHAGAVTKTEMDNIKLWIESGFHGVQVQLDDIKRRLKE